MRTTKRIILPILLSLALILSVYPAVALAGISEDSTGSIYTDNDAISSLGIEDPETTKTESFESCTRICDNISGFVWLLLSSAFVILFTIFFILFRNYKKGIEQSS